MANQHEAIFDFTNTVMNAPSRFPFRNFSDQRDAAPAAARGALCTDAKRQRWSEKLLYDSE
jgi:hypothetical protein